VLVWDEMKDGMRPRTEEMKDWMRPYFVLMALDRLRVY